MGSDRSTAALRSSRFNRYETLLLSAVTDFNRAKALEAPECLELTLTDLEL
jgi:hypothetical protein